MPSSPGGGNRQGWAWDAGIQLRRSGALSASAPLIISGNIVANNYNGISLIESPSSDSGCTGQGIAWHGPCNVQNVLVENNWITMTQGATGTYQDGAGKASSPIRTMSSVTTTTAWRSTSIRATAIRLAGLDGWTAGWTSPTGRFTASKRRERLL